MIYERSWQALVIFCAFLGFTLGLSFWLGRKAKSSEGYFAAHGQIPWFVNGIAFAGDYLSAASFLGICGMIAFYGYDGFLYSIGYLAGWIVALFVVAEPMKRLGKFTFADALDAKFHSRGIKIAAGISTLAVSIFYLIPQMVGAGVLVQPLLGLEHWVGVVLVGTVVILIVVTAGMVSTTWVQFLKGSLLVVFSAILTWMILERGFKVERGGNDGHVFAEHSLPASLLDQPDAALIEGYVREPLPESWKQPLETAKKEFILLQKTATGEKIPWQVLRKEGSSEITLREAQQMYRPSSGPALVNGLPRGTKKGEPELHPIGYVTELPDGKSETGPLSLTSFFSTLQNSTVVLWREIRIKEPDDASTFIYYQKPTPGREILRPGEHPIFQGIRSTKLSDRIEFVSLMLALFCGTASLPHILIRYYTVKDEASARRSTIVGIASIGFFYVLTLYMGLGAMTSGTLDVTDNNMAAPLLAQSMNTWLFAAISAIAFTTVLGTVSGLILASAGAVSHDLLSSGLGIQMTDHEKVRIAKLSSIVIGAVAILLGILFRNMNVSFLVGWAFSVAASANLPSLVLILFWKRVTRQGVIAAVVVGMVSSLAWVLLSGETYSKVYGLKATDSILPFSQPGIITIPLGFLTLILVSLMTSGKSSHQQ